MRTCFIFKLWDKKTGSQNDPNHNIFSGGSSTKCDPFSFLEDDDLDEHSALILGKPLRSDHAISLEDLVSQLVLLYNIFNGVKQLWNLSGIIK